MSQNNLSENESKKIWYLPHQPIFHPHEPYKVWRVCKAAGNYQSISLNNNLLPRPDNLQKTCWTLFKFPEGAVALLADIEQMFLQVKVKEDDTHCLRFLYSDVESENERIVINNYNGHIFGARSSPTCANYALTRTLDVDKLHQLSNQLWRDDFNISSNAQLETENLKIQVVENLSRSGFKLTIFQSNVEELSENAEDKEASVLVLSWWTDSDTLAVCQMNDRPVEGFTQRDFLSVVFSLFDPLGLLSPYTIRIRKILKQKWKPYGVD